jgi:hypothetical protein
MKITTIALAIAFTLPSTFALARGGMSIGSHVTRPFGRATVGAAGRIATRPRNVSGNALAPIAHGSKRINTNSVSYKPRRLE